MSRAPGQSVSRSTCSRMSDATSCPSTSSTEIVARRPSTIFALARRSAETAIRSPVNITTWSGPTAWMGPMISKVRDDNTSRPRPARATCGPCAALLYVPSLVVPAPPRPASIFGQTGGSRHDGSNLVLRCAGFFRRVPGRAPAMRRARWGHRRRPGLAGLFVWGRDRAPGGPVAPGPRPSLKKSSSLH